MKGIVAQASLRLVRTGTSAPGAAPSRLRTTPVQASLVWGPARARSGAVVAYVVPRTGRSR